MAQVYSFPQKTPSSSILKRVFLVFLLIVIVIAAIFSSIYLKGINDEKNIVTHAVSQVERLNEFQLIANGNLKASSEPYLKDGNAGYAVRFNVCIMPYEIEGERIIFYATLDHDNTVMRLEVEYKSGDKSIIYEK